MITELKKEEANKSLLATVFKGSRITAIAGNKHTGKTNNICYMIKEYRTYKPEVEIYVYGLQQSTMEELASYGVREISSLDHLIGKKNCILFIDEFQRLKLNDRRQRDTLNEFVDFVYHNGVYVILSSPNLREFNTIIGGVIEKWLLKTCRVDQCVQGSQLKRVIENYNGRHKSLGNISVKPNEVLVINDHEEIKLDVPYFKEADSKLNNVDELF